MGELEEEIQALKREYEWILEQEVHKVLKELHTVLTEACKNFPVHIIPGDDQVVKPEKFVLTSANGAKHIKCMVTLHAENICEADFTLKLLKQQSTQFAKIYPDTPWRLSQIQDSANHLFHALSQVDDIDEDFKFHSGAEVINVLKRVRNSLQRGQDCLVLPKKKTLEEIINNPQLKCIRPHVPRDAVMSFYVQAQKIVLSVYQLYLNQSQKQDISNRYQVECTVPWLSDVLVFYSIALQLCQQLSDKLSVFKQYESVLHPKSQIGETSSSHSCDKDNARKLTDEETLAMPDSKEVTKL